MSNIVGESCPSCGSDAHGYAPCRNTVVASLNLIIENYQAELTAIRESFPLGHPARKGGSIAEAVRYLQNYCTWIEAERDTLRELLRDFMRTELRLDVECTTSEQQAYFDLRTKATAALGTPVTTSTINSTGADYVMDSDGTVTRVKAPEKLP